MSIVYGFSGLFYFLLILLIISPKFRLKFDDLFFFQDSKKASAFRFLDSFRGMAALMVLGLHLQLFFAPQFDGINSWFPFFWAGQKGVCIFFVLSAFLIWILIDIQKIGAYTRKRILRIYPLHLVLTIFIFLSADWHFYKFAWIKMFLFEATLVGAFINNLELRNPVAWSIVKELQFYVIAPFLKFFYQRYPNSFLIAFSMAFCALYLGEAFSLHSQPWEKYFFVGIAGGIFYEYLKKRNFKWSFSQPITYAAFGIAIAIAIADFFNISLNPIEHIRPLKPGWKHWYPLDLGVSVMILILLVTFTGKFKSFLENKVFRFTGIISYSLYLNQLVLIGMVRDGGAPPAYFSVGHMLLLFFPSHIMISAIMFLCIERPFLIWQTKGRGLAVS